MLKTVIEYNKKHKTGKSLKAGVFCIVTVLTLLVLIASREYFLKMYFEKSVDLTVSDYSEVLFRLSGYLFPDELAYNDEASLGEVLNDDKSDSFMALSQMYSGRLFLIDDEYKVILDSYGNAEGCYIVNSIIPKAVSGENSYKLDEKNNILEIAVPIHSKNGGSVYGIFSLDKLRESVKGVKLETFIVLAVLEALALLAAYFLAGRISGKVTRLTKTIESVVSFEEGDISSDGYKETDGIVKAFNAQRLRLMTLDNSRQEFVSNVSHELKTPITSIKVLAESLILQENAPIEMYRDFMQDIVEEIDRENSIITDLLALVHMEQGKENLNITEVDCNSMLNLIVKRLTPIAKENRVDIFVESKKNVFAELDEVKMTLAITNLVENGIKYNKPHGWVNVTIDENHQSLVIRIEDSGIGIPKEDIPHVFERFYRVDKSHSREIGGTGLGLPLARKIVLLHRGSITLKSEKEKGTVFIVKIPLKYIQ